jgi:hypothetical protein
MPLQTPQTVADRIQPVQPRKISNQVRYGIWKDYNNNLQRNSLAATTNPLINLALRKIQDMSKFHLDPDTLQFDYDRDLHQACLKQCEALVSAVSNYDTNRSNTEFQQKYQEELINLNTLAQFANHTNENNAYSRLLLILGSILAIGYACAYPSLALSSVVNAVITAGIFTAFASYGIIWLPLGMIMGLSFMGGAIALSLGVGMAMNYYNPSPQGSRELFLAMMELREACQETIPLVMTEVPTAGDCSNNR